MTTNAKVILGITTILVLGTATAALGYTKGWFGDTRYSLTRKIEKRAAGDDAYRTWLLKTKHLAFENVGNLNFRQKLKFLTMEELKEVYDKRV